MMKICKSLLPALVTCLIFFSSSFAHEFFIKPDRMSVTPGQKVKFSVMSSHVFMENEEMEPKEQVIVSMVKDDVSALVKLQPNPEQNTLDGAFACKDKGYSILSGHRKGMIWTQTTQGWKQGTKKTLKGVVSPGKKYEKFCKVLIKSGKSDHGYDAVLNDPLEIVPLTDPGTCAVNKEMEFKILCQGQPLSTDVWATYDGFTSNPNTYAYFTQCNSQGIAKVKITHPGTWMVRVQTESKQAGQDYDIHVMRAILVFEVK